jgi:Protein phosphatase 2C
VVRAWREALEQELKDNRLTAEEFGALESQAGPAARLTVEENPLIAYGATLLGVLVTESFVLYLQLGDGDILSVTDYGEVSRPVPGDERLFANETTSLCSSDAWRATRIEVQPPVGSPPALILVASDGYANSFARDSDFLKIGTDLLQIVRSSGLDAVNDNIATWLTETSACGSGDDITLAMICWPNSTV